ncbi:MAG: hypothetical protein HeimC3_12240 [Candidatus Heimdallarchaeota archaeon LC_3]|nr:MAG: hypothetical protein HeimC3_12240 [Candidatus Heimdallarchaeota archaeon LC_3]
MSEKVNKNIKQATKREKSVEDEDYIPESVFARIKSFWLFNRPSIRQVPYIQDLELEAAILYLIPGLVLAFGVFIGLIANTQIDPLDLIIVPLQTFTIELIAILAFLIVLFIFMKIILPGFPNESHARPKMVVISFSYVYITKIILSSGFVISLLFSNTSSAGSAVGILFISFYAFSVYFVVVSAFSIKSLTGIGLVNSLIGGFALFFSLFILRIISFFL